MLPASDNIHAPLPEPAARIEGARRPGNKGVYPALGAAPEGFHHGPISGKKEYLASIICPILDYTEDTRNLEVMMDAKVIVIQKNPGRRLCQVYFKDQNHYARVNAEDMRRKTKQ